MSFEPCRYPADLESVRFLLHERVQVFLQSYAKKGCCVFRGSNYAMKVCIFFVTETCIH